MIFLSMKSIKSESERQNLPPYAVTFYSVHAMKIRMAQMDDSRALAALHAASWRSAYRGILSNKYLDGDITSERAKVWEERFHNPSPNQHIVVAEDQSQLVGFACAYGDEDNRWGAMLDNLHVLSERRGQGIGHKLIVTVASWCSPRFPGKGMFLWVFEQNALARRFYERLGGVVVGETVWTAPDGTIVNELRYAWEHLDVFIA